MSIEEVHILHLRHLKNKFRENDFKYQLIELYGKNYISRINMFCNQDTNTMNIPLIGLIMWVQNQCLMKFRVSIIYIRSFNFSTVSSCPLTAQESHAIHNHQGIQKSSELQIHCSS